MDIIRAVILGLVQALTEFLPISSSAHLILARGWIGFESVDGLTFDVALHVGTLVAILAYFRRDFVLLIQGFVSSIRHRTLSENPYQRLSWLIIVGTLPAALAGAAFEGVIENVLRSPLVIVFTLIAGAVLFFAVERLCRPTMTVPSITLRVALTIGIAQSVALIPGVSRSGITTAVGMTQGLQRSEAARFSFLLGAPIMLGASIMKGLELENAHLSGHQLIVLAVGVISSGAAGWFVIRFLLRFLQTHRLDLFSWYRIGLAVLVLIFT